MTQPPLHDTARRERGFVLLAGLFLVLLVGGLAAGLLQESQAAKSWLGLHEAGLKALEVAEVGVIRAEMEIRAQVDHGDDGIGAVGGAMAGGLYEVTVRDDPVSDDRWVLTARGEVGMNVRRVEVGVRRRVNRRRSAFLASGWPGWRARSDGAPLPDTPGRPGVHALRLGHSGSLPFQPLCSPILLSPRSPSPPRAAVQRCGSLHTACSLVATSPPLVESHSISPFMIASEAPTPYRYGCAFCVVHSCRVSGGMRCRVISHPTTTIRHSENGRCDTQSQQRQF